MSTVSNAALRKRAQRARQREYDPDYLAKNNAYAKAYRERKRAELLNPVVVETEQKQVGGAKLTPMDIKQTSATLYEYSQANDRGDHLIKAKTALDYSKRLLYMTRVLSGDSSASLIDFEIFRDVDRVWDAIQNGISASGTSKGQPWSLASKIVYMSSITGSMRRLPGFEREYAQYSKIFAKLHKEYDIGRKDNQLTASEEIKFIPWPTIQRLWRATISDLNTTEVSIRNVAIMSLYVGLPPRRAADYQLMYIADEDTVLQPDRNYLMLDSSGKVDSLIFNTYKTSKRYGTYTIDSIPDDVARVLAEYLRISGRRPGSLLFPTRTNTQYSSGAYSILIGSIFKKLTGRRVTVNILRHAAITHFLRKKRSVAAREAYALQMGHSVEMQSLYERINAPTDSGDIKMTRNQKRRAARKAAKRRHRT
jgi:hypothetical protein